MRTSFVPSDEPIKLKTFFAKIKKGSRLFRKIFTYQKKDDRFFSKITQVRTFKRITGIQIYHEQRAQNNLASWNTFCYPNRLKVFLFKYYNNVLGVGSRIAHFNQDVDPSCFFCSTDTRPAPLESFSHIFYNCPHVLKIITKFFENFFAVALDEQSYFSGQFCVKEVDNQSIMFILDILRYSIWQTRLRKMSISYHTIFNETVDMIERITCANKKIENNVINCTMIRIYGPGGPGGREGGGGGGRV